MARALIRVEAAIDWTADAPAHAVLLVRAAGGDDQAVIDEALDVRGATVEEGPRRVDGARPVRIHAERPGEVRLRYRARVEVDGAPRTSSRRPPPAAAELGELPRGRLPRPGAPVGGAARARGAGAGGRGVRRRPRPTRLPRADRGGRRRRMASGDPALRLDDVRVGARREG